MISEISRRRFIGSSLSALGAASLSLAGCAAGTEDADQPAGRSAERPNILLLVTDDQRWDALGCAGNTIIHTPNMDDLAGKGIRFANAFVTTPICAASRATLFTGLYERTHGYTFTKPPLERELIRQSYPYLLRRTGYRTGFVGKLGVALPEGAAEEMFDLFQPSSYPYLKEVDGKKRHLTDINTDRAVAFLRECRGDQPFCLSFSFWAPHAEDHNPDQYVWPEACNDLYRDVVIPDPELSDPAFFEALPDFLREGMNRKRWHWRFDTAEKHQRMVKGYYRMISGVDRALGRLMKTLEELELDKNTVVVLLSDNGYFLGERGFAGKWTMHEHSIRIPMIYYDPRRPATQGGAAPDGKVVCDEMVLNVDVAPTLLSLAGLPVPENMQGRSLLPLVKGEKTEWRDAVFCEHLWDHPEIPMTESIRTKQWKYIRYLRHPEFEELYDLGEDPLEEVNLAGKPRHEAVLAELRARCDRKAASLSKEHR